MGMTIIEKIFTEHTNKAVCANDDILINPDLVCIYEIPGYVDRFHAQMKEFGIEKVNPS